MIKNKIPAAVVLLVFSWVIVIVGLIAGLSLAVLNFKNINYLLIGISIVLVSLLMSAIVRMFANIGQMVFDSQNALYSINQNIELNSGKLTEALKLQFKDLGLQIEVLNKNYITHFERFNRD
ncbi:MAG: hypothetical protein KJ818_00210, partial [Candidatus Omnitrophica bacterium]|nr:hypothetical protein [Candidatus Omnitrophota bacterium]